MFVDKGGIRYTCQPSGKGAVDDNTTMEGDETDSDVQWNLDIVSSEDSLVRDAYRSRVEDAKKHDEQLADNTYYTIKVG